MAKRMYAAVRLPPPVTTRRGPGDLGRDGGLVPLALQRFGFDPAIASSIFVTTFTDVGGFFSFFGLATLAIRYLAHA